MASLVRDDDGNPRTGVCFPLEDQALAILTKDRRGVKAYHLLNDWLSPDQWLLRENREYLLPGREIDYIPRGIYGRAYHLRPRRPHSRDRYSVWMDPWHQDWFDSGVYSVSTWWRE